MIEELLDSKLYGSEYRLVETQLLSKEYINLLKQVNKKPPKYYEIKDNEDKTLIELAEMTHSQDTTFLISYNKYNKMYKLDNSNKLVDDIMQYIKKRQG